MTAEQQLERSVLESKERDELHAIAQALSVKTNTRTKKADIIDGILKATGVAVNGGTAGSANGGNGAATNGDAPNGSEGSTSDGGSEGRSPSRRKSAHSFGPADNIGQANGAPDLDEGFGDVTAAADAGDRGEQGENGGQSGAQQTGTGRQQGGGSPQGGDGGRQGNQPGGNRNNRNNQNSQSNQNSQNSQSNRNNQANRNNQGNRNNQNPQGGGNDDAGNRRSNRRRRGRERQGGGEGDLQGSGTQDQQYQGELIPVSGLLDLRDEGYGFLRCEGYLPSTKDVDVSISQARRFALRKGDRVEGFCRPAGSTEKFPALLQIDTVSGLDPEVARL